ncbi:flagellar hook-associated protein 2 [Bacillus sp. UMB0728]|uniref:flagellar hook-associated protein 2 n=1 Tax=Bacillus sp. UMB0728 TaxID=2066052 RepID=UPI000C7806F7|nr:flagellar hook-associated protein 2 [Bacillus sp. UMB0728]PLR73721.1 flagellar cap protein FliD [Bacillus sp. UMB0728]
MVRIGGLASGMDIDQLVSDLMKAERMPLDKINQKKQYTEWQRDDYRSMNKKLLELDQLIFDGIGKQGSYIKKSISSTNPDAVGIKNINSTSEFSGSIEVTKLATAATMHSLAEISIDPSEKLDKTFTDNQEMSFTIKSVTKDGTLESEGYTLTFKPSDESINSIISKINSNSNVTAFFDANTKRISFTAKNTGDVKGQPEIKLEGDFLTDTLKLSSDNVAASSTDITVGGTVIDAGSAGSNAQFTYNGLPTERSSNTFQINGVEFSLKKENTGKVTFSSSPDVDAIMDTIVKFVDKYNEVIEEINDKTDEKRYRDFQPLTAEQRKEMEEKDIELWEEKAKSGTLRGDSILTGSLNKMRSDLYSPVSGLSGINQLAQIGITTTSNYLEGGKLTIKEDDLRKAISENPNGIYELFQKEGSTASEQGLARRLRDSIKSTMTDIEAKAGKASSVNNTFTIGKMLDGFDKQITRFEDRLTQVENRYWSQFTAMEKAIQRSNEQMAYLMQQFGG